MNFKFVIEGLSKKIIFSIITVIQFVIVMLSIYVGISELGKVNSDIESINSLFKKGNYYKIKDDFKVNKYSMAEEGEVSKTNEELIKVMDYFHSNPNIKMLSVEHTSSLIKKDEILQEGMLTNMVTQFDGNEYFLANSYYLNKEFLKQMDYEFLSGNFQEFELNETSNDIPIILGYKYSGKYKVGDSIDTLIASETKDFEKVKFKVIGILSEGKYLFQNVLTSSKESLDNAIVMPFNAKTMRLDKNRNRDIDIENYLIGGYVKLNDNESMDKINKDLEEFEIRYQIEDVNKEIKEYKKEFIEDIKPLIYMCIIVILFSIISVVIVMINSIVKDKKEFGINIMIGATMKDIKIRVLGQVALLLGISICFLLLILNLFSIFKFSYVYLALTIAVMFFVIATISTIILWSFKKYSINDLIRRGE